VRDNTCNTSHSWAVSISRLRSRQRCSWEVSWASLNLEERQKKSVSEPNKPCLQSSEKSVRDGYLRGSCGSISALLSVRTAAPIETTKNWTRLVVDMRSDRSRLLLPLRVLRRLRNILPRRSHPHRPVWDARITCLHQPNGQRLQRVPIITCHRRYLAVPSSED
jgi:hypothetical protein